MSKTQTRRRTTRSQRRFEVRRFLERGDLDGLVAWARTVSDAPSLLVGKTVDRDELLRWRAIEGLGRVCGDIAAEGQLEKVRGIVRRFLWLMNDESGGIGWSGPEAIGEILVNVPELVPEYGRIVASFVDESPFGPGAHWAIARFASFVDGELDDMKGRLLESLCSDDPSERANGLLALAELWPRKAQVQARRLLDDQASFRSYEFRGAGCTDRIVGNVAREVVSSESKPRTKVA